MIAGQYPKVSIITCFLNVETYLEEAIQSVLQQTWLNWELLLIDDGSTDKSTLIAKRYSIEFPGKIYYKEHEGHRNNGLSFSRNTGISYSTGVLLAFLDGDDAWMPLFLENIIACWKEQQAAMVCEATLYWHSWEDVTKKDYKLEVGVPQDKLYLPPELLKRLYPLGPGTSPCICSLIVEKRAVLQCGCFEQPFRGMYEDQAFHVKLYLQEKIYISSGCNNKYRQRKTSLVNYSVINGLYEKDRGFFLKWMGIYISSHGAITPDILKLFQSATFPYRFPAIHFLSHTFPKKIKKLSGKNLLRKMKQRLSFGFRD
jgi:glycosyltransferase involved in cell wall biosynthesis